MYLPIESNPGLVTWWVLNSTILEKEKEKKEWPESRIYTCTLTTYSQMRLSVLHK